MDFSLQAPRNFHAKTYDARVGGCTEGRAVHLKVASCHALSPSNFLLSVPISFHLKIRSTVLENEPRQKDLREIYAFASFFIQPHFSGMSHACATQNANSSE